MISADPKTAKTLQKQWFFNENDVGNGRKPYKTNGFSMKMTPESDEIIKNAYKTNGFSMKRLLRIDPGTTGRRRAPSGAETTRNRLEKHEMLIKPMDFQ